MSATPEPRTRDRAAGGAGEPPGAPQKKSGIRRSVSYDAGVGGPGGGGTAGMRRTQSGDGNSMPHTPEFPLELTRSSHFKCLTYMLEHVASDDEGDGVARCTSSAAPSVASSQDHGLSASRGSDKSHMLVPVGRPSSFASGTHSQASIAPADALAPRGLASPMMMMLLFIGTHSVTTTLNVHSRSRSFVGAIDLRGLAPSVRLFRRPNTNGMKK